MLKLRSEHKTLLILMAFSLLLREYLTWSALGFMVIGAGLIVANVRVPKLARNVIALGIFGSYWVAYGKVIDPEVGLNFLVSVVMIKMLEKESKRDEYMIFFGLLLLLSTGTLFEKNLTYVFFFLTAFIVMIFDFYGGLKIRWRTKDLALSFLWVLPLTAVLFFLAPRVLSPLAFRSNAPSEGKVGYTPDLNVSDIDKLSGNDSPVFNALITGTIDRMDLYWRGNVLLKNDGWNWRGFREPSIFQLGTKAPRLKGLRQEIFLLTKDDYLFGLDTPAYVLAQGRVFSFNETSTNPQDRHSWISRYEVISVKDRETEVDESPMDYSSAILSRKEKTWIAENFRGATASEIVKEVKSYFRTHGFTYSVAPGRISNFRNFMREKRTGFCAHYASALGLIFRVKGLPTRLVSGFMGGEYNSFADYYLITQNDAHVWVEVHESGRWNRYDPTAWVAPARVQDGGEAFMGTQASRDGLGAMGLRFDLPPWFRDAKHWFSQWDFKFYRWLDEMDYNTQLAIFSRLNLERKWMYAFVPALVVFFGLLYVWYMAWLRTRMRRSPLEKAWANFLKKSAEKGLKLETISVSGAREQLNGFNHPDSEKLRAVHDRLVEKTFNDRSQVAIESLLKDIARL